MHSRIAKILAGLAVVVFLYLAGGALMRAFDLGRGLLPFIKASRYQDFHISGKVVDEKGAPIDSATVVISTSRRIKMGTDSESNTTFRKPASNFDFSFDDYSSINLTFVREGYEQEVQHFNVGGSYTGLVVTLRRKSKISPSQPTTASLE